MIGRAVRVKRQRHTGRERLAATSDERLDSHSRKHFEAAYKWGFTLQAECSCNILPHFVASIYLCFVIDPAMSELLTETRPKFCRSFSNPFLEQGRSDLWELRSARTRCHGCRAIYPVCSNNLARLTD